MKPHGSSALISNTMLCEVSRLFSEDTKEADTADWRGRRKKDMRVVDLLSLIEAVSLHEVLYTLPARISSDASSLKFRSKLISSGIIRELDTTNVHHSLAKAILTTLSETKNPVRVAGSAEEIGSPIEFSGWMRDQVSEFLLASERTPELGRSFEPAWQTLRGPAVVTDGKAGKLDDPDDFFSEGGSSSSDALYAPTLEDCSKVLIGWIEYHSSGAYEHCTSIIRDMYYVLVAEEFHIPYWPQSTRREFTSRFPNYLDKSLLVQLYARLAKEFRTTVTDIYDYHKEEVTFIPPFSSLVLQRAGSKMDILNEMLEVRDEYAQLRKRFTELELEMTQARTIVARLKLRKQQRYLLDEMSSAFDRHSLINLEGVIRYVPQALNPVMKPTDPTAYSSDLLLLPAKQLVGWWRRRPIARFFSLADKLKKTENYPTLVQRIFGSDVSIEQFSRE